MEDGGFTKRQTAELVTMIFGDICQRCMSVPCECGTPEFEKFVELELAAQSKEESLQRGDL